MFKTIWFYISETALSLVMVFFSVALMYDDKINWLLSSAMIIFAMLDMFAFGYTFTARLQKAYAYESDVVK